MNEIKPDDRPDNSRNHQNQRPYWKRAHRSVGFWIAVFLMLAAMIIYVMSDDLAGWHHAQPRQPLVVP